jgi:hypothetical protein
MLEERKRKPDRVQTTSKERKRKKAKKGTSKVDPRLALPTATFAKRDNSKTGKRKKENTTSSHNSALFSKAPTKSRAGKAKGDSSTSSALPPIQLAAPIKVKAPAFSYVAPTATSAPGDAAGGKRKKKKNKEHVLFDIEGSGLQFTTKSIEAIGNAKDRQSAVTVQLTFGSPQFMIHIRSWWCRGISWRSMDMVNKLDGEHQTPSSLNRLAK